MVTERTIYTRFHEQQTRGNYITRDDKLCINKYVEWTQDWALQSHCLVSTWERAPGEEACGLHTRPSVRRRNVTVVYITERTTHTLRKANGGRTRERQHSRKLSNLKSNVLDIFRLFKKFSLSTIKPLCLLNLSLYTTIYLKNLQPTMQPPPPLLTRFLPFLSSTPSFSFAVCLNLLQWL